MDQFWVTVVGQFWVTVVGQFWVTVVGQFWVTVVGQFWITFVKYFLFKSFMIKKWYYDCTWLLAVLSKVKNKIVKYMIVRN